MLFKLTSFSIGEMLWGLKGHKALGKIIKNMNRFTGLDNQNKVILKRLKKKTCKTNKGFGFSSAVLTRKEEPIIKSTGTKELLRFSVQPAIVSADDKKRRKIEHRFRVLLKQIETHGFTKPRHTLRYIRWATFLGKEIPQSVLDRNVEIQKKFQKKEQKFKKKYKAEKKKERKYNRIPRKYAVYIDSKWWTKRKNLYYQIHRKQCAVCDSSRYIHLHHMVYNSKEYGNEKDEHLIPLCNSHHKDYHEKNGTQKNMLDKTLAYVKEMRLYVKTESELEQQDQFLKSLS